MKTWVERSLLKAEQDHAWIEMAMQQKLRAEEAFLTILSKRAHNNLVTPHEMIVGYAHAAGLC